MFSHQQPAGCQLEAVCVRAHDVSRYLAFSRTGHSTAGELSIDVPACFFILLGVVPWHVHHAQTGTSSCLFASFHLTTVFLSDILQCPRGFCTTVSHEAMVDLIIKIKKITAI